MSLTLQPPIKPMLAKSQPEIPTGSYIYDPKWDGFRTIAYIEDGQVELRSRSDRAMGRFFPESWVLLGS
jgi:ATP-dependent DNA ligase